MENTASYQLPKIPLFFAQDSDGSVCLFSNEPTPNESGVYFDETMHFLFCDVVQRGSVPKPVQYIAVPADEYEALKKKAEGADWFFNF